MDCRNRLETNGNNLKYIGDKFELCSLDQLFFRFFVCLVLFIGWGSLSLSFSMLAVQDALEEKGSKVLTLEEML